MTDQTEVRAAAERLRRSETDEKVYRFPIFNPLHTLSRQLMEDLCTVRDAYLSEHPPDSDEPIIAEWLEAVGGNGGRFSIPGGGDLYLYVKHDGGCRSASIEIGNPGEWYGCNHEIDIPAPQTRGDVRRLAADLGVTLKEKS